MTLLLNNAEGGTNGAAVTTTTSGAGNGNAPFSAVSPVTAGAISFKSSSAWRGALGYSLVQAVSANACTFEWADTAAADFAARWYFRLNAFPSAQCQGPFNVRTSTAQLGRLNLQTTAQISTTIGTTNVTDGFSTAALAVGTWYRFETLGAGFGTAATSMVTRIYVGDATGTPFITTQVSGVTTVGPAQVARFGRNNAQGSNDWDFDDVALNIAAGAVLLGPSNTGDAGLDQIAEPGSTVTLAGSGTGTWAQLSGTAVTLAGSGSVRTFTAPYSLGGGDLVFAFGGTTTTVTVLPVPDKVKRGSSLVAALVYVAR